MGFSATTTTGSFAFRQRVRLPDASAGAQRHLALPVQGNGSLRDDAAFFALGDFTLAGLFILATAVCAGSIVIEPAQERRSAPRRARRPGARLPAQQPAPLAPP